MRINSTAGSGAGRGAAARADFLGSALTDSTVDTGVELFLIAAPWGPGWSGFDPDDGVLFGSSFAGADSTRFASISGRDGDSLPATLLSGSGISFTGAGTTMLRIRNAPHASAPIKTRAAAARSTPDGSSLPATAADVLRAL